MWSVGAALCGRPRQLTPRTAWRSSPDRRADDSPQMILHVIVEERAREGVVLLGHELADVGQPAADALVLGLRGGGAGEQGAEGFTVGFEIRPRHRRSVAGDEDLEVGLREMVEGRL